MGQVAVLGPSEFFGEDALLETKPGIHSFTVVADTTCSVGWLRPSDMMLLESAGEHMFTLGNSVI